MTIKLSTMSIQDLHMNREKAFDHLVEAKQLNKLAGVKVIGDKEISLMETIIMQTSLLIADKVNYDKNETI
jgi:hypothetical protein